jgi:hypothetical protein
LELRTHATTSVKGEVTHLFSLMSRAEGDAQYCPDVNGEEAEVRETESAREYNEERAYNTSHVTCIPRGQVY